jgi:hypothetical protein
VAAPLQPLRVLLTMVPLLLLNVLLLSCCGCRMGGWQRFQELLSLLSTIAGREGTSIQGVALRWLADQDVIPQVCPLGWDKACNKMWAATLGLHPAQGAQQRAQWLKRVVGRGAGSFLTEADVKALAEFTLSSK